MTALSESTPTYAELRSEVTAAFPTGACFSVERSRGRRYPGLRAPAPDTRALYRGLTALYPRLGRVVDLGCGAGQGVATLYPHAETVTGFEPNLDVVSFARQYLRDADIRPLLTEAPPPMGEAQWVTLVDVVGQAPSAVAVLRAARRTLGRGGRLYFAEPRAHAGQLLMAPLRRAFSEQLVSQLFARSGFGAPQWLVRSGPFLACTAPAIEEAGWPELEAAEQCLFAGNPGLALQRYEGILGSLTSWNDAASLMIEARIGAAVALAQLRQLDAACVRLLEAGRLAPADPRPYVGLAEAALAAGDTATALALSVRALERHPVDAGAAAVAAQATDVTNPAEALALFRIANNLAPDQPATAFALAQMAAGAGQPAYALWVLERARERGVPQTSALHITAGWLNLTLGRLAAARAEVELAATLDPTDQGLYPLHTAINQASRPS
jgi:SAM-dependent methyltransferase